LSGADWNGDDGGGGDDGVMCLKKMKCCWCFDIAQLMLVRGRFGRRMVERNRGVVLDAAAAAAGMGIVVGVMVVDNTAAVVAVGSLAAVAFGLGYNLVVGALEGRWIAARGGSSCVVNLLAVLAREHMALVASQLEDMTTAAALFVVDCDDGGGVMVLLGEVAAGLTGSLNRRSGRVVVVELAKRVDEWRSSRWLPW